MPKPSITYTWGVAALEVAPFEDGLTDVVKTIHWTLSATDGEDSASSYSSISAGTPDPEQFTPYADLTKEQVSEWLEGLLDGDELRSALANQIAAEKDPPIITPALPWA